MRGRVGPGLVALFGLALLGTLAVPAAPARAANYIYLSVVLSGGGSGRYQTLDGPNGNPDSQIDCRMVDGVVGPQEVCAAQYDLGTSSSISVYYRITPDVGSCNFTSGSCQPTYTGSRTMNDDVEDTAAFIHATVPLSVFKQGSGTVTSSPAGVTCGATCGYPFGYGATVTLTATPASGWQLLEWAGDCASVTAGQCIVKMNGARNVTTKFAALPTPSPGVSPTAGSSPSPQATAGPKPSATAKVTAPPAATGSPSSPAPASGSLPAGSPTPETPTAEPGGSPIAPSAMSSPAATQPAGTGTTAPVGATSSTDLSPIILAILGAGLFIAIAIGLVGYALYRRGRPIRKEGLDSPPSANRS